MNPHRPASCSSFLLHPSALGAAAFLAALLLYAWPLCRPVLSQDDFQILAQSWTWQKTCDGLLAPNNEHAMPLGRLLTFVVAQLAGRATMLPFAGVLTGVVGLFFCMALTYVFVRRELGHPFYGLTALVLFGVSAVYQQAVYWFAASFSVFALAFLLLALLAAQRHRQTGQWGWLLACAAWCALAPCWFATGVLAGPFCCLYLLPSWRKDEVGRMKDESAPTRRSFSSFILHPSSLAKLTPLLGTAAFLAVVLPITWGTIQHLEHYQSRNLTALEAFHPLTGAWNTVRSVVDNLTLGVVGISGVTVGAILAPPLLALLIAFGVWWTRRSSHRRLALLGAGLIFASYLLIYSGRAMWDYDGSRPLQLWPAFTDRDGSGLYTPVWSRYHLQPQLGLALVVCAGLPAWEGRRFRLDATGRLTAGQTRALAWLLGLCLLIQAPRGAICYYFANPRQAQTLSRIDRVSAFCREHRISAEAAADLLRAGLGKLDMWQESITTEDGWEFLRGSDRPEEPSLNEIRDLIEAAR